MGATYTRQSSYTDGDVITAAHTNNEFDQILAAFQASDGHTHDGTANEGGPITTLLGSALIFGSGADSDITVSFNTSASDGEIKWLHDDDRFQFTDDIIISSTEKLFFNDTGTYINSNADGDLDLVSDGTNADAIKLASAGGITLDAAGDIILDADGDDITLKNGSATYGSFTNSSGELVIKSGSTPTTAMTFSGANVTFAGTVTIGSAGISEAELEILDGATVTTTELNIMDGDTTASSTTVVDADRVVFNDAGTMKQVAVTDLAAYFDDEITAMPNLVSTGALDSGSITSNFGTINTGSSTITTTGLITGGSLDIDDVVINGTTIGHTDDTDLITLANGSATIAGNLTLSGDLTVSGDDITMGTNTAGHLLIADGTNFNSVAVGSLSEISSVANDDVFLAVDTSGGGLKKITRSAIVSGLATSSAISNVSEDTTPQLGGDLDVNGNDIVSVSNGNITITPNGSGVVRLDGNVDIQSGTIDLKNSGSRSKINFYCESGNAHAQALQAAPHSESASNTLTLPSTGGDVNLVSTASTATLTNKTFGDNVSFGDNNITNVGDIALDSISADGTDINVAVSDNSATAFTIKQGSDNYFVVDTGNSSESIAIGTGISGTAITLGHSTSEVTVADNLTVTGDLTVSGTTTTVNSTTVNLNDHNIILDSGNSTSAVINGAGITLEGGTGTDASFLYSTTGPKFELKLGSDYEDLQVDQLIAASLDISGNVDVDGTLEADAITVDGTALDTHIAGVTVTNATNSAHVLVTDNESTNEENLITFVEGATDSTGNVGLEMDGNLSYNPSTGTVTATIFKGNIDAVDGDFDGTLEADAMTLNGTAITTTATLSTGISNGNVFVATSGIADNDFLRVDGTSIEGRSASEVLSDIGATTASAAADEATALAIALG